MFVIKRDTVQLVAIVFKRTTGFLTPKLLQAVLTAVTPARTVLTAEALAQAVANLKNTLLYTLQVKHL